MSEQCKLHLIPRKQPSSPLLLFDCFRPDTDPAAGKSDPDRQGAQSGSHRPPQVGGEVRQRDDVLAGPQQVGPRLRQGRIEGEDDADDEKLSDV